MYFLIFGIVPKKCEKFDFFLQENAQNLQKASISNFAW